MRQLDELVSGSNDKKKHKKVEREESSEEEKGNEKARQQGLYIEVPPTSFK